ncbi:hypothetical protein OTU49_009462 [Cherax quadricarinatus]|uniref:Uncharacterized protein n=1 Tax=Cherax quadricarinatus TaxID=27406 RepID=A0AAW0WA93_CHEQU
MRLRKVIFRQLLSILQRVPRPVYQWTMWCRCCLLYLLASHRCRVVVLSSTLLLGILLLSIPNVPERFLGIRSPERVLESFISQGNNSSIKSEKPLQPIDKKMHSVKKRQVPHKFWARARPHNKFKNKRKYQRLQLHQNHHDPRGGPILHKERIIGKSVVKHYTSR